MTVQLSTTVRNARLDQIETTIGTSPILKIRTGTQPATCATADSGTVLATLVLPANWLAAASGGTITISGAPWQDIGADASGTAGYFRIYDSTATTCHLQGSVGQGTGDLSLDSTTISIGQTVSITAFTLTDGNP